MSRLIDADALKEKYTMVTKRYSGGIMERPAVLLETIDEAPTIEPKQADDLISRADAMHVVFKSPFFSNALMEEIKAIPSAQPKRGEWAKTFKDIGEVYPIGVYTCSCCGDYAYAPTKYCPNCGARMNSSEKPNNCGEQTERSE